MGGRKASKKKTAVTTISNNRVGLSVNANNSRKYQKIKSNTKPKPSANNRVDSGVSGGGFRGDEGEKVYAAAAKILDLALSHRGSVKSLCLNSKVVNKKKIYALVCESLKWRTVLLEILNMSGLSHDSVLKGNTGVVLLHDHIVKGCLRCGGKYKSSIRKHQVGIDIAVKRLLRKKGVDSIQELLPKRAKELISLPRYIRVNKIKVTRNDVVKYFVDKLNFSHVENSQDNESLRLKKNEFMIDEHLQDILILASNADLHKNPLYLNGSIIIQDKASCFPAHALSPPPGSVVIDGCAAPGNKTSHLASLMSNKGTIYAFDISERRLETLKTLTGKAGASCITPICQSFLETDVNDPKYKEVEYILLDPSCSGSGIVSRLDSLIDNAQDDNDDNGSEDAKRRLVQLAEFQQNCILHAFTFPNVKRVSYSTCSVHEEENELVVKALLEKQDEFKLKNILPMWPRRGLESHLKKDDAQKVVRVMPEEDKTNGFFVALFERQS